MLTKKQLEDVSRGIGSFVRSGQEAAKTALAYREMLGKMEFPIYGNYVADECIMCRNARYQGHKADCKLGKLLRGSEVGEDEK